MRRMNASRNLQPAEPDVGSIVFATGGYDHSIKFWHPHDGVCYRTAQHPESVSYPILFSAHAIKGSYFFLSSIQQVNRLEVTPDKRLVAAAGTAFGYSVTCDRYSHACTCTHTHSLSAD